MLEIQTKSEWENAFVQTVGAISASHDDANKEDLNEWAELKWLILWAKEHKIDLNQQLEEVKEPPLAYFLSEIGYRLPLKRELNSQERQYLSDKNLETNQRIVNFVKNDPFYDTVSLMADNGADVNYQNQDGESLLSLSLDQDSSVMYLLFSHGALPDQNFLDLFQKKSSNPMYRQHVKTFKEAQSKFDSFWMDTQKTLWEKSYTDAVADHDVNRVAELLKQLKQSYFFTGLNEKMKEFQVTPLEYAVNQMGKNVSLTDKPTADLFRIMQLLVKEGSDPNAALHDGKTLLDVSLDKDPVFMEFLLQMGAKPSEELKSRAAAYSKHDKILRSYFQTKQAHVEQLKEVFGKNYDDLDTFLNDEKYRELDAFLNDDKYKDLDDIKTESAQSKSEEEQKTLEDSEQPVREEASNASDEKSSGQSDEEENLPAQKLFSVRSVDDDEYPLLRTYTPNKPVVLSPWQYIRRLSSDPVLKKYFSYPVDEDFPERGYKRVSFSTGITVLDKPKAPARRTPELDVYASGKKIKWEDFLTIAEAIKLYGWNTVELNGSHEYMQNLYKALCAVSGGKIKAMYRVGGKLQEYPQDPVLREEGMLIADSPEFKKYREQVASDKMKIDHGRQHEKAPFADQKEEEGSKSDEKSDGKETPPEQKTTDENVLSGTEPVTMSLGAPAQEKSTQSSLGLPTPQENEPTEDEKLARAMHQGAEDARRYREDTLRKDPWRPAPMSRADEAELLRQMQEDAAKAREEEAAQKAEEEKLAKSMHQGAEDARRYREDTLRKDPWRPAPMSRADEAELLRQMQEDAAKAREEESAQKAEEEKLAKSMHQGAEDARRYREDTLRKDPWRPAPMSRADEAELLRQMQEDAAKAREEEAAQKAEEETKDTDVVPDVQKESDTAEEVQHTSLETEELPDPWRAYSDEKTSDTALEEEEIQPTESEESVEEISDEELTEAEEISSFEEETDTDSQKETDTAEEVQHSFKTEELPDPWRPAPMSKEEEMKESQRLKDLLENKDSILAMPTDVDEDVLTETEKEDLHKEIREGAIHAVLDNLDVKEQAQIAGALERFQSRFSDADVDNLVKNHKDATLLSVNGRKVVLSTLMNMLPQQTAFDLRAAYLAIYRFCRLKHISSEKADIHNKAVELYRQLEKTEQSKNLELNSYFPQSKSHPMREKELFAYDGPDGNIALMRVDMDLMSYVLKSFKGPWQVPVSISEEIKDTWNKIDPADEKLDRLTRNEIEKLAIRAVTEKPAYDETVRKELRLVSEQSKLDAALQHNEGQIPDAYKEAGSAYGVKDSVSGALAFLQKLPAYRRMEAAADIEAARAFYSLPNINKRILAVAAEMYSRHYQNDETNSFFETFTLKEGVDNQKGKAFSRIMFEKNGEKHFIKVDTDEFKRWLYIASNEMGVDNSKISTHAKEVSQRIVDGADKIAKHLNTDENMSLDDIFGQMDSLIPEEEPLSYNEQDFELSEDVQNGTAFKAARDVEMEEEDERLPYMTEDQFQEMEKWNKDLQEELKTVKPTTEDISLQPSLDEVFDDVEPLIPDFQPLSFNEQDFELAEDAEKYSVYNEERNAEMEDDEILSSYPTQSQLEMIEELNQEKFDLNEKLVQHQQTDSEEETKLSAEILKKIQDKKIR